MAKYKEDLSFQPLFWDLEWSADDKAWVKGKITNLENEDPIILK